MLPDSEDSIRAAIQRYLDKDEDGYTVGQWAVALSIERINSDGELESQPWCIAPPGQADWHTDALLREAEVVRVDDDD